MHRFWSIIVHKLQPCLKPQCPVYWHVYCRCVYSCLKVFNLYTVIYFKLLSLISLYKSMHFIFCMLLKTTKYFCCKGDTMLQLPPFVEPTFIWPSRFKKMFEFESFSVLFYRDIIICDKHILIQFSFLADLAFRSSGSSPWKVEKTFVRL